VIKQWKVQVIHDDTKEIVKTLEYSSERLRDKGFQGLLINMNLGDYTAHLIDPPIRWEKELTNDKRR
jgi:hypothetical protein